MEPRRLQRPWFESPFFEKELAAANLDTATQALVANFARDGYVVFELERADFDRIAEDIVRDMKQRPPETRRILDGWREHAGIRALACDEQVSDLLRLFYKREPFPFQTLNFPVGTEQASHTDMIHFSSIPERFMCGVWIALEDIDERNGPLHYYPGSHRLPFYDLADLGVGADSIGGDHYRAFYEPFIAELATASGLPRVELRLERGQGLIWAANLLHGGSPIRERGRTRFSQVTHYYFENCVYYTPLHSDLAIGSIAYRHPTDVRTGEIVPSRYLEVDVRTIRETAVPPQRLSRLVPFEPPEEGDEVRFSLDRVEVEPTLVRVSGWAFLPGEDAGRSQVFVVLESGGRRFVADTHRIPRPDIVDHFPDAALNLDTSGFEMTLPRQDIAAGTYRVGLCVRGQRSCVLHFSDQTVTVE